MSFPAEGVESALKNNIEDVRLYLDAKHPGSYAVYNLCLRKYRPSRFHNRVSECGWPGRRAPNLVNLYSICKNIHLWLKQNPKNVCIVHCLDGRAASAVVVCSFLCFCRLFTTAEAAVYMFSMKRCPPGIWPSHKSDVFAGNQGKHRVTKRRAALSNPMFTLVTIVKVKKNNHYILTYRCLSSALCFSGLAVSTAAGKQSGDVTALLSGCPALTARAEKQSAGDRQRYIEYMCDMMAEEPIIPHSKPILIKAIAMTPVPLFSKLRNGCRPFCEVYVGDERVATTSQEYDKMRDFRSEDGKAEIPLDVTVQGDVLIVIYHARSTLGGRLQAKSSGSSSDSDVGGRPCFLTENTDKLVKGVRASVGLKDEKAAKSLEDIMFGGLEEKRKRTFPVNSRIKALIEKEWRKPEKSGKPELPRQPGSTAQYEAEISPAEHSPEPPSSDEQNQNNFFQTLDWQGTYTVQQL
ncbi:unnamed protein product [Ranitomeya imitator]|uniref:Uncharacterized protein n=1 Tax=Ranitomeya imitator TaxID=111125 RepID=A0ABN9KTV7_9NEOB|nr:unnamed protein product [Ranitomeya imitator]